MKKICIIGQFPPPIHGLSKALQSLYDSYLGVKFKFNKIDLTNNKKILKNILIILQSNSDVYYLTLSQSKLGNIRDVLILILIQIKKKKTVIHLHGGRFRELLDKDVNWLQKKINYKILSKVNVAIVLGDSMKGIFYGIIDEDKIKVVKNGVDNKFVLDNHAFEKKICLFEKKKKLNILYLSNFIEDKGYKHVLKLAKLINNKKDNRYAFIFAGKFFTDKDKNDFFNYIVENNLQNIVQYKGTVYGEEKKELLNISDYFILLSKNEGQPISIIEAAVNGLRVISTDLPGIKDILNEEEMVMYSKNLISVKKVYEELNIEYNNRPSIVEVLKSNRKKMLQEFSEDKYHFNMEQLFEEL